MKKINPLGVAKFIGYSLYIVGGVVIALCDVPNAIDAAKQIKIKGPK